MDFFIALLAIVSIALFFVVRFRLNAAVAPFFSIALVTVWLCLVCMTGLLIVGVWLVFAFAAFALVYVVIIKKQSLKEIIHSFVCPGMVFFIVSSVLFYILLSVKHPWFNEWDEYSFWGIAVKGIFENHQIYTLFESSMINTSYQPGLPLWSFFVQFFGRTFTEWKVFLAYDVMMMAVMSMLFARVKWKNFVSITALCLFGLFSLYTFWHTFEGKYLYCTSYADIQIGVVFGGVVLSHFYAEDNRLMKWFVSLAGVMLLPMLKDIGMALGLVAAGIVLADTLISQNYPTETLFKSNRKLVRVLLPLLLFAAVLILYQLWNIHYAAVSTGSRDIRPYEYSAIEIFTGKDPYFNGILKRMIETLSVTQITVFGPITTMMVIFTLVPIVIGVLTRDKIKCIRLLCSSVLLLGGFLAFALFHAYAYTAIFTHTGNYDLVSFPRYMSTYASGWMIAATGICFFEVAIPKIKKCQLVAAAIVAALATWSSFYYNPHHPDQYIFISSKIGIYREEMREIFHKEAVQFKNHMTMDDTIYFVCQESNGGEWFRFQYEFMFAKTQNTLGGGNFVPMDTPASAMEMYDVAVDRETFISFIRETGVDYIFVFSPNMYFYDEFAPLFSDYLAGYSDRSAYMYLVVDNGGDDFTLVPVPEGEFLPAVKERYGVS